MINRIRKSFAKGETCQHGGKVREIALRMGTKDILDFSANINPQGPPPLQDIFDQELARIGHYPDNEYSGFKNAAARYIGVSPEEIVPGNGSSEIIRIFAEMTLTDGDRAYMAAPTFGEYKAQSTLFGAEVVEVETGAKTLSPLDIFDGRALEDAKAVFFCNPNNPTGILTPGEEVAALARRCEEHETFLLVDEAFIELSDPAQSVAKMALEMDFLVVMRSLTKSFGVPGLRLGFGVTNPVLAEVMNRARIPWSIGSVASACGAHLLGGFEGYLEESRMLIRTELAWLTEALRGLGLRPVKSSVNFILVNVSPTGLGSSEIAERMAQEEKVLVRDCSSFTGLREDYIRVAVRDRGENQALIRALDRVL